LNFGNKEFTLIVKAKFASSENFYYVRVKIT